MPAQASADTPQLLTIDCSSGVVGGPSSGKLTRDIAARYKPAYCEPTTVTFQHLPCQLCS
ncbi:hypothetical protein HaLaN_08234, partial [Haematococcus lacustris]